jgi:hypothetical protein
MDVAVIADPEVNRLLAPAGNTVEFALQIKHQLIDEAQIGTVQRGILNAQQIFLKFVARGFQRILQFTQRP